MGNSRQRDPQSDTSRSTSPIQMNRPVFQQPRSELNPDVPVLPFLFNIPIGPSTSVTSPESHAGMSFYNNTWGDSFESGSLSTRRYMQAGEQRLTMASSDQPLLSPGPSEMLPVNFELNNGRAQALGHASQLEQPIVLQQNNQYVVPILAMNNEPLGASQQAQISISDMPSPPQRHGLRPSPRPYPSVHTPQVHDGAIIRIYAKTRDNNFSMVARCRPYKAKSYAEPTRARLQGVTCRRVPKEKQRFQVTPTGVAAPKYYGIFDIVSVEGKGPVETQLQVLLAPLSDRLVDVVLGNDALVKLGLIDVTTGKRLDESKQSVVSNSSASSRIQLEPLKHTGICIS